MANVTQNKGRFGTFGGVFTPSTLTILGVIMFLRFGHVVGESGLLHAIVIVLCAKLITFLTALSISAIATNTRVQGGGAYFLISRSLGVEFGGAIGVVFFLAQAISVAMYVIGFTEAFLYVFPDAGLSSLAMSTIVNGVVFICVMIGASWTVKVQYGVLGVLLLSLISFYVGVIPQFSTENLVINRSPDYLPRESLFTMFALFFPAVTGIMAGVNMSGDLKSPSKSIPKGTLQAIGFTALIYLSMAVLLAGGASRENLLNDTFVMMDLSWSPALINAGIFAATISSALGSMIGAPRILQALAKDDIFPKLRTFAKGSGSNNEPRNATILTLLIAQGAIMIGDLNAIAPIITMFFMVTYGTINLACFYESITNNPSYRPAFKWTHWITALLGALGCLAVMILMAPVSAILSILAMVLLMYYISRKEIRARWGDVNRGRAFERARKALLKLEDVRYHPKNWRPIVVALSGGAWMRNHLAEYGYWLTSGHGVLTLAQIITGDVEDRIERREAAVTKLRRYIQEESVEAFPAVVVEDDILEGMKSLIQCHGIGGFAPNTVMLGWSENPEHAEEFGRMLRLVNAMGCSSIVLRCPSEESLRWDTKKGTIDIWWRGGRHGPLMLLLAHLLVKNQDWRGHKIRILLGVNSEADHERARTKIEEMLQTARVNAEPVIISGDCLQHQMRETSKSAFLVMMGFDPPAGDEEACFVQEIDTLIEDFHHVILVSSVGGVSLMA